MYCPECGFTLATQQIFEREDAIIVCEPCFMAKPFGRMYCGQCGLLLTYHNRNDVHVNSDGIPLCSDCLWATIETELDNPW